MTLIVDISREIDGRYIAEVRAIPGVLAYGRTERGAYHAAVARALHVIADAAAHGAEIPTPLLQAFALRPRTEDRDDF